MEMAYSFILHLRANGTSMVWEQIEDAFYNCLDFCIMHGQAPHFFIVGDDAIGHPEIWKLLELVREEGATFSLLSGPEKMKFASLEKEMAHGQMEPYGKGVVGVMIMPDGNIYLNNKKWGNIFEDRLADFLICGAGEKCDG